MNRITAATCLSSAIRLQQLQLVAVLGDDALDADARDLPALGEADAFGGGEHDEPEGEEGGDHRQRAPQRQAPAQAAAVKDGFGLERHGGCASRLLSSVGWVERQR